MNDFQYSRKVIDFVRVGDLGTSVSLHEFFPEDMEVGPYIPAETTKRGEPYSSVSSQAVSAVILFMGIPHRAYKITQAQLD
jgi:hypothetical protein